MTNLSSNVFKLSNRQGTVLVATVWSIALAISAFSLLLVITSNYFRFSNETITRLQHDYLAQGAMTEAIVLAQNALYQGNNPPHQLLVREETDYTISAYWQSTANGRATIEATGSDINGKATIGARFLLANLPVSFLANAPAVVVSNEIGYRTALVNASEMHIVLLKEHFSGISLNDAPHFKKNLAIIAHDGALVVSAEQISGEKIFIDGDLLLTKALYAQQLIVTGDLLLANGVIDCADIIVYGDAVITGMAQINGILHLGGEAALDKEAQAVIDKDNLSPLVLTRHLVTERIW